MAPGEQLALGAVLAGGAARRMGGAKATVELAGRPLIEHPLSALGDAGLEAVVVAKRASALPALDVPVWEEPDEPVHPLAGVVHALRHAGGRPVLAVACDMPFLTADLLAWMAGLPQRVVVPRAGGRLHPLLARYDAAVTAQLDGAVGEGLPAVTTVQRLDARVLAEPQLRRFGDPARLLANVNHLGDLRRAEELLASS